MCTQMRRCVNGSYVTDNAAKKQTTETHKRIYEYMLKNRNDKLKKNHTNILMKETYMSG